MYQVKIYIYSRILFLTLYVNEEFIHDIQQGLQGLALSINKRANHPGYGLSMSIRLDSRSPRT